MPKAARAIRELALLRRYVAEVLENWRLILGSAAVIGALWVASHFGASLWSRLAPLIPQDLAPWLTRDRLIAVFVVLAIAQYLAWRKLRLQLDREVPSVDSRLEFLQEVQHLTKMKYPRDPISDQVTARLPRYHILIRLKAAAVIDPPILLITYTEPVSDVLHRYYDPRTKKSLGFRPRMAENKRADEVLVPFGDEPLPPGTVFSVTVHSTARARLKSVEIAPKKKARKSGGRLRWRRQ